MWVFQLPPMTIVENVFVRILDDIYISIRPGETVALVGSTGAGKTSFVNLIARMYDVTEGSLTIDDQNLKEVQQRTIAQGMGVVLQDPFLFSASVNENILFGRPDASSDEVIQAAKTVGAHDFIVNLPNGYATVLEERGENLSVGQRQLISFARAVLADPLILILDESTANVDFTCHDVSHCDCDNVSAMVADQFGRIWPFVLLAICVVCFAYAVHINRQCQLERN